VSRFHERPENLKADRHRAAARTGATAIEYGLIAALVSVAAIAALTTMRESLVEIFGVVATELSSAAASRAIVPRSSASMSREYPNMSAASIAASLRCSPCRANAASAGSRSSLAEADCVFHQGVGACQDLELGGHEPCLPVYLGNGASLTQRS
jgi:pilus assembly protein Flp/PilA